MTTLFTNPPIAIIGTGIGTVPRSKLIGGIAAIAAYPAGIGYLNGVVAPGSGEVFAVLFIEGSASAVATTKVAADGSYSFKNLAIGNYAIEFIDVSGVHRAKTVHTFVPAPPAPPAPPLRVNGALPASSYISRPFVGRLLVRYAVGAVTISVVSGALPSWMSIAWNPTNRTIDFTGTPDAIASFAFVVRATDSLGTTDTSAQSLAIAALPPGHLRWRIYITANNGDTYLRGSELELLDAGSNNLATSDPSRISFSSQYDSSGNAAKNMFNGDTSTGDAWATTAGAFPAWIAYTSDIPIDVVAFKWWPSSIPSGSPKNFQLEYGDEGSDWTLAAPYANQTSWTAGVPKSFSTTYVAGAIGWNGFDSSANMVVNADNSIASKASGSSSWDGTIRGSTGKTTGKHYFEVSAIEIASGNYCFVGLMNSVANLSQYIGYTADGAGYYGNSGSIFQGGGASTYGPSFTKGDVIGVKLDADAGTVEFIKNNVALGSYALGSLAGQKLFPALSFYYAPTSAVGRFAKAKMRHPVPTGYSAWDASGIDSLGAWDDSDRADGMTLTNNNLTAQRTGGTASVCVRATKALVGKRYWEVDATWSGSGEASAIGIASVAPSLSSEYMGSTSASCAVWGPANAVYKAGSIVHNAADSSAAIYMFAFNAATGELWIGTTTGGWFTGDPGAGTSPTALMVVDDYYPTFNGYSGSSSVVTINLGATAFAGSIPSGYNT